MADLIENLITAWIQWENTPSSYRKVIAKEQALHNLNLNANQTHDHIATWRRAGYSIPDAIQSMFHQNQQEAA